MSNTRVQYRAVVTSLDAPHRSQALPLVQETFTAALDYGRRMRNHDRYTVSVQTREVSEWQDTTVLSDVVAGELAAAR